MNSYTDKIKEIIDIVNQKETDNINKAALLIYQSMKRGEVLHVFATGHSHMIAEEMFYRAGGLVQVDPILVPALMQHEGAIRSTHLERLPGLAKEIYNSCDIKENEVFLISSFSGINSVPIEMAQIVKKNNHPLIVITSYEVSKILSSRAEDKSHLYDYADVLIDNHCPYGDGVINTEYGNIGASSSIICNYIAQRIVIKVVENFMNDNIVPPIYQSANTKGGDSHNKKLYEEYKSRIKPLF